MFTGWWYFNITWTNREFNLHCDLFWYKLTELGMYQKIDLWTSDMLLNFHQWNNLWSFGQNSHLYTDICSLLHFPISFLKIVITLNVIFTFIIFFTLSINNLKDRKLPLFSSYLKNSILYLVGGERSVFKFCKLLFCLQVNKFIEG